MLAGIDLDEVRHTPNPRSNLYDAVSKAREAVDRARTLDPEHPMALLARAVLRFRAGDREGFRARGARMIALNPNDPELVAELGARLAMLGDWASGMRHVRRGLELALEPPDTYDTVLAWDHYRKADYPRALQEAERIQMPEFQLAILTRAAIYGRLGMEREALAALADLRELRPNLAEDPSPWLLSLRLAPTFAARLAEGVANARALTTLP
jgi:tetratricopeptide (TPR) repeat protein